MNSPRADDMEYQRVLVAAIKAEIGGRGMTRKRLGELAGISAQQMERIFNLKRQMNVQQLGAIADALGVTMDYLAGEAQRWATQAIPRTAPRIPDSQPVNDPRTLLDQLLNNPDTDAELVRRMDEVAALPSVNGNRLKRLQNEIRLTRMGELQRALDALPPIDHGERAN